MKYAEFYAEYEQQLFRCAVGARCKALVCGAAAVETVRHAVARESAGRISPAAAPLRSAVNLFRYALKFRLFDLLD